METNVFKTAFKDLKRQTIKRLREVLKKSDLSFDSDDLTNDGYTATIAMCVLYKHGNDYKMADFEDIVIKYEALDNLEWSLTINFDNNANEGELNEHGFRKYLKAIGAIASKRSEIHEILAAYVYDYQVLVSKNKMHQL